jgi:uncharacterized RDD family membrane protein YckC
VSCPRCGRETKPTLSFCAGCGAPLALRDEAPPRPLDFALPLDRRTPGRTPLPLPVAPGPEPEEVEPEPELELAPEEEAGPPAFFAPPAPRRAERSHWDLGAAVAASEPLAATPPVAASEPRAVLPSPAAPEPLAALSPVAVSEPRAVLPRVPAAPRAGLELPEPDIGPLEIHLRRAPAGRRALAWAVDVLPFAAAVGALARSLLADAVALLPAPPTGLDGVLDLLAREAGIVVPLAALLVVALFVYTTLAHALAGATLGKWVARVRLAGPDGRRPSLSRSTARSALAVLSAGLLGLGFLAALFTRSGRALHDVGARTWVVEA